MVPKKTIKGAGAVLDMAWASCRYVLGFNAGYDKSKHAI